MHLPSPKLILLGISVFILLVPALFAQNLGRDLGGVLISVSPSSERLYKQTGVFGVDVTIENTSNRSFQITGSPVIVLRGSELDERGGTLTLVSSLKAFDSDLAKKRWLPKGKQIEFYVDLVSSYQQWRDISAEGREKELLKVLRYGEYSLTAELWNSMGKPVETAGTVVRSVPAVVSYVEDKKADWSGVSMSIVAGSETIKKGGPFSVNVTIENNGTQPFPLGSIPALTLTGKPFEKNGVVYPPRQYMTTPELGPNSEFRSKKFLNTGERLELVADLTDLTWVEGNASIFLPENLFTLVSTGSYTLAVELREAKGENDSPISQTIKSNPIQVILE